LGRRIGIAVNCEGTTGWTGLDGYLNGILCEDSILCNGPVHGDRRWIVRARVRPGAAAGPPAKTVTHLGVIGRRGTNRDSRSGVFPPISRLHCATGPVGHRQEILRLECCGVGLVRSRRNGVRDGSTIAPLCPHVPNACPAALRGSCGYGMTRPGRPGKVLCRAVASAINSERETWQSCLDSHLDRRWGGRSRGGTRPRALDFDRYWRACLKEAYCRSCGLRRLVDPKKVL
jgi:hypothetical protein